MGGVRDAENFLIDPIAAEMMRDASWMSPSAYQRKWEVKLADVRIATMLWRRMPKTVTAPGALATAWRM